ncbi:MAG: hypothetical protein NTX24_04240 [Candidatus Pacearchaeota archaeon]|nr:hypothetical protein [Candidatus Pacearchaeota archaeon]
MPNQSEAHDRSLAVYLNGFAHVTTSVGLKTQNGVAQVGGIPSQVMLESLHPILDSRDVVIAGARIVKPTTLVEIAQSQLLTEKKVYDSNSEVLPLVIDGNNLLVKGAAGMVYSKSLDGFRYVVDDVAKIRARQDLELRLGGIEDGKETRVDLAYLTDGIELGPSYNITLVGDKLRLTAEVKVDNQTGKSYEDVELKVIPGKVKKPEVIRRFHNMGGRFGLPIEEVELASLECCDGVTRSEENGQIVYSMGKRDLPLGESKFGLMNKIPELDYKMVSRANLGKDAKPEIITLLTFEAPLTFPVGSVAVYSERRGLGDKAVTEYYEGGGQISHPALKGSKVSVDLRTPDTLEMKVEQVGQAEMINTEKGTKENPLYALQSEFKVTAKNAGQDDVRIETYLALSSTQKLIESRGLTADLTGILPSIYTGGGARWNVPVKAGQETTFTYKIRDEKFIPMGRAEIARLLKSGEDVSLDID